MSCNRGNLFVPAAKCKNITKDKKKKKIAKINNIVKKVKHKIDVYV